MHVRGFISVNAEDADEAAAKVESTLEDTRSNEYDYFYVEAVVDCDTGLIKVIDEDVNVECLRDVCSREKISAYIKEHYVNPAADKVEELRDNIRTLINKPDLSESDAWKIFRAAEEMGEYMSIKGCVDFDAAYHEFREYKFGSPCSCTSFDGDEPLEGERRFICIMNFHF